MVETWPNGDLVLLGFVLALFFDTLVDCKGLLGFVWPIF